MKSVVALFFYISACLLSGCAAAFGPDIGAAEPQPAKQPAITLVAVGDNLLHLPIIRAAETAGGYNFGPLYSQVKHIISSADIAFVNQEGPIAANALPAGYPEFNAPQAAGLALAEAGFNVISQANNHSLDQGSEGLSATAAFWHGLPDVTVLGLYENGQKLNNITIVEAGGYKFAWLAYSYGSNKPLPGSSALPNAFVREAVAADIAQAREKADAVIVSMHWGEEYRQQPTTQQQEQARFLAAQGVSLIIGHHPHVVQPLEWLDNGKGGQTVVAYSLGNFISSQNSREAMLEALLTVEFIATEQGLAIEKAGLTPLVMHYERNYSNYAVFPLAEYTENLAARHFVRGISLDYLNDLATAF